MINVGRRITGVNKGDKDDYLLQLQGRSGEENKKRYWQVNALTGLKWISKNTGAGKLTIRMYRTHKKPRHSLEKNFYPTRGRVAQNERDQQRDEETERGVQCS
jgi:hypothetical protein